MKSFTATSNDAGKRLDKFIQRAAPGLPISLMYRYLRTKRIKVNNKKCDCAYRLAEGDVIDMYIGDEFFTGNKFQYDFLKAGTELNIIYEDKNILLLDKKAGVLCHPDKTEYVDTLITRVHRYLYEKGEYNPGSEVTFTPALANRIDRNTGGIVIAAKNAEALKILNEKIKNREIIKKYLCVTVGTPKETQGIIRSYLKKDEKTNMVRVFDSPAEGSRESVTRYTVLDTKNNLSLVEAQLLTGRTHQIRAQLAHIGAPLLGDTKYNPGNKNKALRGQLLYSYKLKFEFTQDAGILNYLNGKEFEVRDVWFREDFYNGKLKG